MEVLITGISGFAESYLAEFLLNKGYEVFGTFRENKITNRKQVATAQDWRKCKKSYN